MPCLETASHKTPNWLQMPSAREGDEGGQRRGMRRICEGGDWRRGKESEGGMWGKKDME